MVSVWMCQVDRLLSLATTGRREGEEARAAATYTKVGLATVYSYTQTHIKKAHVRTWPATLLASRAIHHCLPSSGRCLLSRSSSLCRG